MADNDSTDRDQSVQRGEQRLCGDCPPIGYPTEKTRCSPCPRRAADGFLLKAWSVSADGFQPYTYYAASRARALRDAWHGYCNYRAVSFKEWLTMARCSLRENVPDEFGQAITVGGKPAFFVTSNSQYVQFVRPYALEVFNAHPYDVEPEHMRPSTYRKDAA